MFRRRYSNGDRIRVGIKRPLRVPSGRGRHEVAEVKRKTSREIGQSKADEANKRRSAIEIAESTARIGEPIAYVSANTVASCPATAAEIRDRQIA